MSERLTDEELTKLITDNMSRGKPRPNRAFTTSAVLVMVADELRTRRAADLTDEEREALRFARDCVDGRLHSAAADVFGAYFQDRCSLALTVLDRLIGGGK